MTAASGDSEHLGGGFATSRASGTPVITEGLSTDTSTKRWLEDAPTADSRTSGMPEAACNSAHGKAERKRAKNERKRAWP